MTAERSSDEHYVRQVGRALESDEAASMTSASLIVAVVLFSVLTLALMLRAWHEAS